MTIKGVKLDKFLKDFGEDFENGVPEDFLETLDFVFNRIVHGRDEKMKKRNSKIFQEYYFSDLSLRELGEKYGISCERVRQIINFVTNRIKFPKNLEILKAGIKNSEKNIDKITLQTAVEDMGLSIRAINSLKRGKINNLKDLLEINSAEDFFAIRGIGRITAHEIINKVHSLGFKMRCECEGGTKWRG